MFIVITENSLPHTASDTLRHEELSTKDNAKCIADKVAKKANEDDVLKEK